MFAPLGTFSSVYRAIDLYHDIYDNSHWNFLDQELPQDDGKSGIDDHNIDHNGTGDNVGDGHNFSSHSSDEKYDLEDESLSDGCTDEEGDEDEEQQEVSRHKDADLEDDDDQFDTEEADQYPNINQGYHHRKFTHLPDKHDDTWTHDLASHVVETNKRRRALHDDAGNSRSRVKAQKVILDVNSQGEAIIVTEERKPMRREEAKSAVKKLKLKTPAEKIPKFVAIKRIYVTSSPARIKNEIEILHDLR
jgi:hypothetical protein